MFVLDELDKILQNLVTDNDKERKAYRIGISLDDIERIDVSKMRLGQKLKYPMKDALDELTADDKLSKMHTLDRMIASDKHLSTDSLFVSQISPLILPRLADKEDRHYPGAKLMICDRISYDMLLKFKRIWSRLKNTQTGEMTNFIFKSPFNVTAIFLLPEIVDLVDREREPIVLVDDKKRANYNYPLIRRLFPYLKLTSLAILLNDRGKLQLGTFTIDAPREHQILQFICHFARESQIIELNNIVKLMGMLHLMYNNVLMAPRPISNGVSRLMNNRPTLSHLSTMANQLVQLADKLRLDMNTITLRAGDPYGQTKVFPQMVITCLGSRQQDASIIYNNPAKVIVLDRFFDLQSPLYHADSYGAFTEQEKQDRLISSSNSFKFKIDTIDELDGELQLVSLTEVLSTIIRYASSLKPKQLGNPAGLGGQKRLAQIDRSLSNALAANQSIRRHLDAIKLIYRCLNDGYLLLLRLESSLENLQIELGNLTEPLPQTKQVQVAERIERIAAVFKQLASTTGSSITAMDLIRAACIMIGVINSYQTIHGQKEYRSKEAAKILESVIQFLLNGSEFKKVLKSKLAYEKEDGKAGELLNLLTRFEKISREACSQKCPLTIEQILNQYHLGKLDEKNFPKVDLMDKVSKSKVIVLVFLGVLTPHELSKIKSLETTMKSSQTLDDIYILTCGISRPDEFLRGF